MRLPEVPVSAVDAVRSAQALVSEKLTPTVRLGVTGLSGAGKTVLITAIVRNLVAGGRLPFLKAEAEGRLLRAWLEPQPDDSLPRFEIEAHCAALAADPPRWPESTRRISELRLVVEYLPRNRLRRRLGSRRLNIDIVDYPGEWLVDLGLLDKTYADWSAQALAMARSARRLANSKGFLDLLPRLDPAAALEEPLAQEAAAAFTSYLARQRATGTAYATLGPGRFLMAGDLAGSPLLTFAPLEMPAGSNIGRGTLAAAMARRFESYKTHVVRRFFDDHFSRIDRQIVLVDALGALDSGRDALADLEQALDAVLRAFRPGSNSWLSSWLFTRVDRLMFAATKADHLHHKSHDALEKVLRLLTDRAIARASAAGARVDVVAMAALRATREAEAQQAGAVYPLIVGVPMAGEWIDDKLFDGLRETAIFPGDLPSRPEEALAAAESGHPSASGEHLRIVRFRPPRIPLAAADGRGGAFPHIRLDRALEFLIGDRLT
jgi:predicted YcjX-like family ATPase